MRAIEALQDAGVEPDIWKIEGLDRREDCLSVVASARREGREQVGCIVLGRGEDEQKVIEWLRVAATVPGFIGFAVGRSSFLNAIVNLQHKKMTRSAAVGRNRRPLRGVDQSLRNSKKIRSRSLFLSRTTAVSGNESAMSNEHVKLAPSILAADFARLGEQIAEAEAAGADRIHIDVMDGHFVPNLTMGVPVVKSLRAVTELPLEVHLMITDPDLFIEPFADAGADTLIVHWEGNQNLHRTLQRVRRSKSVSALRSTRPRPPRCWSKSCATSTWCW